MVRMVCSLRYRADEYLRRFYPPPFQTESDRLLAAVRAHLPPGGTLVDAGCGSGRIFPYDLKGRAGVIIGVDASRELAANASVTARVRGTLERLPLADATVDVILCKHTVEHLAEPAAALREFARVLRPGGVAVILTPNKYHYVPLLARLLPHPVHVAVNRRRGVAAHDVFPTFYRANTAGELRRLAREAGLRVKALDAFESQPSYLAFHPLTYFAGMAYERLVNRFSALDFLRVNLLAVLEKAA